MPCWDILITAVQSFYIIFFFEPLLEDGGEGALVSELLHPLSIRHNAM